MTDINNLIPWIPTIATLITLFFLFKNNKKSDSQSIAQNAGQLSRIETTLDSVRGGVDDLRVEIRTQQKKIDEFSERLARVEESDKSAHKRIDTLERGYSDERKG